MKRGLTALIMVGVLAFVSVLCFAAKEYKVGAVFSITGEFSSLGVPERNTVEMIVEDINSKGGINGHPLKVIIYDTKGNETECRTLVQRLIEKDKVLAIIGPSLSGTSLKVVPLAERYKVPLVSCAASVKIVKPVKKWVFKTPQTDTLAVERIYDYMQRHGIKKIAAIYHANDYGKSGLEQMKKLGPKYGISVIADESYAEATDVTSQLTKLKAKEPDALICWDTSRGAAIVTRDARRIGFDMPIFMSHGIASRRYIELAGDAAEGVIFPAGKLLVYDKLPDTDPQKSVLASYAKAYKERYGKDADTFGGHAWDALHLVIKALKEAGPDRAKIRDAIERTKNFIGTGGVFNFSPEEHNGLTKEAFVLIKIVNGKWTLLE